SRTAGRARDLHAAICEHKMCCVVSLRDDVNSLLFVRPPVQMRDQLVQTRRQIQMDWRASSRLSVHENLGATGFAGNVCECPNKREGFIRRVATLHLDVAAHFPVAVGRDDRVFAGWKISYGLRRYAFTRNLTVLASQ